MRPNHLKLGVDVVSACNLKHKDGQGSPNLYVELFFDGQRYRTTVKDKPEWNESFYFSISDPRILHNLNLEAFVYSTIEGKNTGSLLGKVSVNGTSFVLQTDVVDTPYPLKNGRVFSRVRGEIRLKVYITNNPSITINCSTLLPSVDNSRRLVHADLNPVHSYNHHHDHSPGPEASHQSTECEIEEMRDEAVEADSPPPNLVELRSTDPIAQPVDIAHEESLPYLGDGRAVGDRHPGDLVEGMEFLYVNVAKARNLPIVGVAESPGLFVEVRVGKYKGVTKKKQDPEWSVFFAFSKDGIQNSVLDVEVKNYAPAKDESAGIVRFDLHQVPMRVPPNSPLVLQWYCLEDSMGEKTEGELMLAVWTGTQSDAAFYEAWHFDDDIPVIDLSAATCTQFRPKVYHAPTLWYARVTVIEARNLEPTDRTRFPELCVKARMGDQERRTKTLQARTLSPNWNESLFFVVDEPFEGHVVLTVENHISLKEVEILGNVTIPLCRFDKRADHRPTPSQWYHLGNPITTDQLENEDFSSALHLRHSLDGGYHVLDESTYYSSDLRPTVKGLWEASIGVLELGICKAEQLHPMKSRDGKETSDTYCVAKYGKEWVRTRTIIDSLSPKYNEQYKWDVYDRATVLTVGVFDNSQFGAKGSNGNRDLRIGKVEIRISTLIPGLVYTHSYPLMDLRSSGVETMGHLHLVVRFSSPSCVNLIYQYSRPLLPKMHYVQPIPGQETMCGQAAAIVAMRLGKEDPALGKEVVEYMLELPHFWSMRRTKANLSRLMSVISGFTAVWKWFQIMRYWRHSSVFTIFLHFMLLLLTCFPELILPTAFLHTFFIVLWNYRRRPRNPYIKDAKFSQAERGYEEDLGEEFDTFPTSQTPEVVRERYDRLRKMAVRLQDMCGQLATQGERFFAVMTWRDPVASVILAIFCVGAALLAYAVPMRILVLLAGFYVMRPPRLRSPRLYSLPGIFISRLPDRTEAML